MRVVPSLIGHCFKSSLKHISNSKLRISSSTSYCCYRLKRNYSEQQHHEICDILISGGGMVGMAMACALGKEETLADQRIILLESGQKKVDVGLKDQHGLQVSAISTGSVDFLNRLGVWEAIKNMRFQPVTQMQVWESCSDSRITLNHEDMQSKLAYIIENDVILSAQTSALDQLRERVTILYGRSAVGFDSCDDNEPFVRVHLDSGDCIKTRLLIGADGFNSVIRQAAGFNVLSWNYHQIAVVANLQITEMENTIAWQRFLPSGPIALLPLTNSLSSLVWTLGENEAKKLMGVEDESFVDAINDAFWHERHKNDIAINFGAAYSNLLQTLSKDLPVGRQLPPTVLSVSHGKRAMFPLAFKHSSQYVANRIALIGDAAHRVHPLAGQGVNLGFGDVAQLCLVIADAAMKGGDFGSKYHLARYETMRQRRNLPVMLTLDGLQKLYSTHSTPVVLARTFGLQTTNAMSFVKRQIIQQAARML